MAVPLEKRSQLFLLESRLSAIDRKIQEYTVIVSELAALPKDRGVFTRQASGLILYRTDRSLTHSQHQKKLEEMKIERRKLKEEMEKLTSKRP